MSYTVYLRTNLINGKQYVGQTNNFKQREAQWKSQKCNYANKELSSDRFIFGLDNWKSDVLAVVETREEAWELEKKYISELSTRHPNGYNRAYGGRTNIGGTKGYHTSPSTEFKKGMISWMKGKKMSPEHREKDRIAHLGKISEKRIPIVKLDLDYNFLKEYTHCEEASKELGFTSGESIRKACKDTWRTSGGFKWMHKDDYEKMLGEQDSQQS